MADGTHPNLLERVLQRLDRTGLCHIWTGTRHRQGYGLIDVEGKTLKVHRVVWELVNGPIPKGMKVCHDCFPNPDNPSCANPAHLFLGTQGDNMRDAARKGRLGGPRPTQRLLSLADIQEMRDLKQGGATRAELRERFGVSKSTVQRVLTGICWADRGHQSPPV